ncbi:MAG: hypothetical protein M1829_003826 [Trizodia sp. TS-e1964]|nr:MAG: hypothetical protein M1829_003826 [Trizodia sp. TS-e1964]
MLGLENYESSDEERDEKLEIERNANTIEQDLSAISSTQISNGHISDPLDSDNPILGPTREHAEPSSYPGDAEDPLSRAQSPYSLDRSAIRDLTLPLIPDLDIPSSPPGSPPHSSTSKFSHFLLLKRQGVHFNEKLLKSSALRNPSLLQKLMSFAGIDEMGQYESALPKDIWDAEAFPAWAYKEELAKSQKNLTKKKEEEAAKARTEKGTIEFVPAMLSDNMTRGELPAGSLSLKDSGKGAAERVIAGLNRDRLSSHDAPRSVKQRDLERRGDRNGRRRSRDRSHSPSRLGRKRSRS